MFGSGVFLVIVSAFAWFAISVASILGAFFVLLFWAPCLAYFLSQVYELVFARPRYFFVSDRYFGFLDRRGRHQWDRALLRGLIRNWINTGDQGLDGRAGYTVLRFMGDRPKPGFRRSLVSLWRLLESRWDRSAPAALCTLKLSSWDKAEYEALVAALGLPLERR